jgi:hypothetical protein
MRKSIFFVSVICVWLIFLAEKSNDSQGDFLRTPITKVKNYKQVEKYLTKQTENGYQSINNKDVKIFSYKEDKNQNGYSAVFFHNHTGKIRGFIGSITDDHVFQAASSKWVNDTMIIINLVDNKNGFSRTIKLFGNYHMKNNKETKISGIMQSE